MTDDALSELAEALDDACRENGEVSAERAAYFNDGAYCPLGALIGEKRRKLPDPEYAARKLGIGLRVARSFERGFDGDSTRFGWRDERAYDLGRLFRERYP